MTFAPGQISRTLTIGIRGENTFEPDESFTVELSDAVHASTTNDIALGTIENDDLRPTISVADMSVAEGDTGTSEVTVVVTLSNPS